MPGLTLIVVSPYNDAIAPLGSEATVILPAHYCGSADLHWTAPEARYGHGIRSAPYRVGPTGSTRALTSAEANGQVPVSGGGFV
jgi:hypothetical protein